MGEVQWFKEQQVSLCSYETLEFHSDLTSMVEAQHTCLHVFRDIQVIKKSAFPYNSLYTGCFSWWDCKATNMSAIKILFKVSGSQFILAEMGDLYELLTLIFIPFFI